MEETGRMKEIRIVYEGGEGEIEEKKSRFIAAVRPVHTEEEALAFIAARRKQYWNASHNCFAYVVGENGQLQRCSDDGEPQGTAGRPMLDVLLGENILDAVVVVTRYFGGTLLGTGGLVRAYGKAVSAGLFASRVMTRRDGCLITMQTNYTDLGKIQYLLGQRGIVVLESTYEQDVRLKLIVPEEEKEALADDITEATGGRIVFLDEEKRLFAADGKEIVLL